MSPRYSAGYERAKSAIARGPQALNPEVVSVRRVCAMREIVPDSMLIAHRRGPRAR